MQLKKKIAQMAVGLVLIACHPTQGKAPRNDGTTATTPITSESTCKNSTGNPFACLAKKCKSAGGTYLPFRQSCDCGDDKVFVGWGEGQCRPMSAMNKCLTTKKGFSYYKDWSEDKFLECTAPLYQSDGTAVNIQSLFENGDLDAFATWADEALPTSLRAVRHLPVFFQMASVNWIVGPGTFDQLDEATLARLTTPFTVMLTSPKESTPVQISYYFEKGDDINTLFTPQEESETVTVEAPAAGASNNVRAIHAVVTEALGQVFQATEKQFFTDDGCAGHCQLRHIGKNFTRRREYVGGELISDQILIWEDPQRERAIGLVQLLPSGQISLVHLYERTAMANTKSSAIRYHVFDRHWRPLLTQPKLRTIIADLDKVKETLGKTANASDQEPQAIVCESGFDIDSIAKLGPDTILLGPVRERSLFGWVDSQRNLKEPFDYIGKLALSGISEFTDPGTRLPFVSYADHAVKVGRKITGYEKDIRLIPISLGVCSDHGDRWFPQVKTHSRAKVVNWSAAFSYTKEACATSPFAQQIRARENDLLYVVGAGNDSLNADAQPVPICPQGLSGAPNLIVVAAGTEQNLAYLSNYGTRFADIVADGNHLEDSQPNQTTSLAAPAVTKLAALLSFQYPKLTPKQIRKAILFGAKIPFYRDRFTPLPVRSGGFLSDAGANAFAALFDREPGINDVSAIDQIYCRTAQKAHCRFMQQRIQILTNNQLLEKP